VLLTAAESATGLLSAATTLRTASRSAATLDLCTAPLSAALDLRTTMLAAAAFNPDAAIMSVAVNFAAAMTSAVEFASAVLAAAPAVPALAATPAQTAAPRITAPVPARALPSLIVPAVSSPAESELDVFDHGETVNCRLNRMGRTDWRCFDATTDERSTRHESCRCSDRISELMHRSLLIHFGYHSSTWQTSLRKPPGYSGES
jgi:hypothetical protein